MAIDMITAHESEINRLNVLIQNGQQLFENDQLNDEQYKQLAIDVGRRFMLQLEVQKLKQERDGRAAQLNVV
ncbi:unnamed protein product [Rotaria magnacalcarata]|uniref:Uncharacterized protein n=1 Tax=Rotaria magnacalcarata TaxID=392030 RepID=A0A815YST0_9BILA|nr:unnamed protein product [Rotaria magnacalcarata]CAF1619745.1 unnamed protein product [Rotaria magnacalcarata]CAF2108710.1 unnamed protein product [Rotaria magnacalcarata]CAF3934685.1 unnamed protein product [Rotaria magnacalcarata]CAF3945348.1 unnamed protein product [Rotaria magnacalcarata]